MIQKEINKLTLNLEMRAGIIVKISVQIISNMFE